MKKRIFSILLTALMVVSLVPVTALGGEPHTLNIDGTQIAWTSSTSLPNSSGHYYLQNDVTMNDTWEIDGEVHLDLNGHTVTFKWSRWTDSKSAIGVRAGDELNLYDSGTNGTITMANGIPCDHAVYVCDGAEFNMYGGTIKGFKTSKEGGAVNIWMATFNMCGGTIDSCSSSADGGAICLQNGTINMSGGTITSCTSQGNGGAVCLIGRGSDKKDDVCTFNMSGGTITSCKSNGNGGAIYLMDEDQTGECKSVFNMTGGSINNNLTGVGKYGGGVYSNNSSICLGGTAKIEGNTTNNAASNLYLLVDELETSCPITIGTDDKAPAESMSVGVDASDKEKPFAESNSDVSGNFFSDVGDTISYTNENLSFTVVPKSITINVTPDSAGIVTAKVGGEENSVALPEAKVTLTAATKEGYRLSGYTVKTARGKSVTVTNNTFTMPDEGVIVTATFTKAPGGIFGTIVDALANFTGFIQNILNGSIFGSIFNIFERLSALFPFFR